MAERPTIRQIQRVVCEWFGMDSDTLTSYSRLVRISRPRQIAMYLACDMTESSTPKIGEMFGGRDHSTVIHARQTITKLMKADAGVRGVITAIRQEIMRDVIGGKHGRVV